MHQFIGASVILLLFVTGAGCALAAAGAIAEIILHIPAIRKFIDSLPAWDD